MSLARRALQAIRVTRARATTSVAKPSNEQLQVLKEKEKLPWNQLSNEEKVQLYRAAYGQTRQEMMVGETDGTKVTLGVVIGISVSYVLFRGLNSLAQPVPKTMTDEWLDATKKRAEEENLNPVFKGDRV